MRRSLWTTALLAALALAVPLAMAQDAPPSETDNDTLGWEDRVVDSESTVEGPPGIVYYVLVAAMSLLVFVGLLYLGRRYVKQRGDRPPP